MPEQFQGLVEVKNVNATTISLDGATGDLLVGGGGQEGSLVVRDANGVERFRFQAGELIIKDAGGTEMLRLSSPGSNIILRDNAHNERIHINPQAGDVLITNTAGVEVIRLAGFTGDVTAGGGGQDGDLTLRDAANQARVKLKSNPASLEVLGSGATANIKLDGSKADLTVGGVGQGGDVILQSSAGSVRLRLEGEQGVVTFRKPNGSPTGSIDGDKADFTLGGVGEDGDLVLKGGLEDARIRLDAGGGAQGAERVYLDGASGTITAGGSVVSGSLSLKNAQGQKRVDLSASGASASLGGNGAGASVLLYPSTESGTDAAKAAIALHASSQELVIKTAGKNRFHADGAGGNVWLGGNGADGDLVLFPAAAIQTNATGQATVHLDAGSGSLRLMDGAGKIRAGVAATGAVVAGSNGANGRMLLFPSAALDPNSTGEATVLLTASNSQFVLRTSDGKNRLVADGLNGNLWLGGNGVDGDLVIFPAGATNTTALGEESIHMNGSAGDILLRNADCAEEFDVADIAGVEAGSVVVLGDDGHLCPGREAYDRRVVGVVSGAGGLRPGIVLDRQNRPNRVPVALLGKVYCKVDADYGAIAMGDPLTTSQTPGHAMRAGDATKSFGAVLGKALRSLGAGRGIIPVLVTLQ